MAGTMHLPIYQQMLYRLAQDEDWSGTVEAPTGAFVAVRLSSVECDLITVAWHNEVKVSPDYDIPSHWLVYEDNQGNLTFVDYFTNEDLTMALEDVGRRFAEWLDENNLDD